MNFGEADKILTILTERFGKIKAISKGVRKIKSHLAGSLEPFMLVDLELYEGKTFFTITGAKIDKEFQHLHKDIKKMSQAFYVAELVDKFVEERERVPTIYTLFGETLNCIERGNKQIFIKAFCLKLLNEAGFKPELFNCVHCKKKVMENCVYWDEVEGGVICEDCQNKYHHGRKVSDNMIKFFRFIEDNSITNMDCLKISKNIENEAENVLDNYIQNIIEREIKSNKFMKELS